MKLPGPDHPITIAANPKRVRVSAGGVVIADTSHALTLKEASYPAVQYVPRGDANMALLARSDRVTHCPYKGDANYFNVSAGFCKLIFNFFGSGFINPFFNSFGSAINEIFRFF